MLVGEVLAVKEIPSKYYSFTDCKSLKKFMGWLETHTHTHMHTLFYMCLEGRNFSVEWLWIAKLIVKRDGKMSLLHLGISFHSLI